MHRFEFYRVARTVQVALKSGADIEHLHELGRRYWLILSRPTDEDATPYHITRLLDSDSDGRIRIPEILEAVAWLKPRLNSFDTLFVPTKGLARADIRKDTEEGTVLDKLFATLTSEETLTEATLTAAQDAFIGGVANGDGVIGKNAVNEKFHPIIDAILEVTGGTAACDGTMGISQANVEAFIAAREAYLKWHNAEPDFGDTLHGVAPQVAADCIENLTQKVNNYFTMCALLRYNPAAKETLTLAVTPETLADAPLAQPHPDTDELPLKQGVNPAWEAQLACLGTLVGDDVLTQTAWRDLCAQIAPRLQWQKEKPSGAECFETMDEHLFEMSGDAAVLQTFTEAVTADADNAPLAAAFDQLRKLLVLRIEFLHFLRNFVNVEDLYPPYAKPLFLCGTLYMDGRACALCFPIAKAAAAHAAAAENSKCCLVYCTLTRPAENRTRTILAVFTAGTVNNLTVGKRGLFFDLDRKDWEATVCHVVPNAISLTEAFFAPWRKVGAAITETVHKFIAGKNAAATASLTEQATAATNAATSGSATPASATNNGVMMASVATLGIALSFIASAIAGITSVVTNTPIWKTALFVLGLICIVSIPSVILTWLKLRVRDLAPILNASDWAINRSIGFTAHVGKFFTQRASYIGKRFICPPMLPCKRLKKVLLTTLAALIVIGVLGWFFCPCSPRNRTCTESVPEAPETQTDPAPETVAPEATAEPAQA